MKTLLKAGIKQQKYTISAIFLLILLMSVSLILAESVTRNSREYITKEMDRLGYGEETLWLSFTNSTLDEDLILTQLEKEANSIEEIGGITFQKLIYAGYAVGDQHSDDEGQMILHEPEKMDYRFLNEEGRAYEKTVEIKEGEIYVSPAMAASFHGNIGDTITFLLSRDGVSQNFKIAGYFEDPFMGSSMIDMKSFLICKADYEKTRELIGKTDNFQILGRTGAMMHVFQSGEKLLSFSNFVDLLQSQTNVKTYMEFSYSKDAILGFMMILQNIMSGFLTAFAVLLGTICALILVHSISHSIRQDYVNIGILKTVGFTSGNIRLVQGMQYFIGILLGIIGGNAISWFLFAKIQQTMVFSTGLLILEYSSSLFTVELFLGILLFFAALIYWKTSTVLKVSPLSAIKNEVEERKGKERIKIRENHLLLSYTLRQIFARKKTYFGIAMVGFLLTFLLAMVAAMNQWLGSNGEGLMDSFSVAEHDIGVQPNHEIDFQEMDHLISSYSGILATYQLAMENGTVNGVNQRINVLDHPKWFHILKGKNIASSEEILVTEYVAKDLGVEIGDQVIISGQKNSAEYTIAGIYACANEMGANIGMTKEGYDLIGDIDQFIWCKHYILANSDYNEKILEEIQTKYPMDVDVHTNSWSGLDSIVDTMKLLTMLMCSIVVVVIIVVVMLTSSKLVEMEQRDIAILRSLGFQERNLRISFAFRFGLTAAIGIILGEIFSLLWGDYMISAILSTFGISDFHTNQASLIGMSVPLITFAAFLLFSYIFSRKIGKVDIIKLIA